MSQRPDYNIFVGGVPRVWQRSDVVLAAGGEDAAGPVENVLTPHLGEPWRTPSLFPHETTVTATWGNGGTVPPSPRTNAVVLAGLAGVQVPGFDSIGPPESGIYARVRKGSAADIADVVAYATAEESRTNAVGDIADLEVDPRLASAFDDVVESGIGSWDLTLRWARPADLTTGDYDQLLVFALRLDSLDEQVHVEMVDSGGTLIRDLYFEAKQLTDPTQQVASARFAASEFVGDLYIKIRGVESAVGAIRWEQSITNANVFDTDWVRAVAPYTGPLAGYSADQIAALSTPILLPFRDPDSGLVVDRDDEATRVDLLVVTDPLYSWQELSSGDRRLYQIDIGRIEEFPMLAGIYLEAEAEFDLVDRSIRDTSADESTDWVEDAQPLRRVSIPLGGYDDDTQAAEVFDGIFRRGLAADLLVQLFPDGNEQLRGLYTVWGLMEQGAKRRIGRSNIVGDRLVVRERAMG